MLLSVSSEQEIHNLYRHFNRSRRTCSKPIQRFLGLHEFVPWFQTQRILWMVQDHFSCTMCIPVFKILSSSQCLSHVQYEMILGPSGLRTDDVWFRPAASLTAGNLTSLDQTRTVLARFPKSRMIAARSKISCWSPLQVHSAPHHSQWMHDPRSPSKLISMSTVHRWATKAD